MADSAVNEQEKPRVAFVLLDGLELDTLQFFRDEGILPNVDRLMAKGQFRDLDSRDSYAAEATPTEMLTGQTAEEINYWSLLDFDPESYRCTNLGAYRGPAFYDRPDVRSIVFDVPHMRIDESTPGVQVAAWGAHSAQFPRSSNPPELIVELEDEFGTMHTPEFEDIHASHNVDWGRGITDHMLSSLSLRPKIVSWLMDREPEWDLLFIGSTETHVHEHAFHHSVEPEHELYNHPTTPQTLTFMRELFVGVDQMVGEIEALLPEGTTLVLGAMHGAKPSAIDSSAILAGEMVYRDQTGKQLLDLPLHMDRPVELETWQRARNYIQRHKTRPGKPQHAGMKHALIHYFRWVSHRYVPLSVERWIERRTRKAFGQTELWWTIRKHAPLTAPIDISGALDPIEVLTEPSNWYSDDWAAMKFFVVPSFSSLQIRINLEGREANGIVKAEDYDAVCDEVEELLSGMTNAVSGEPLIERFVRLRSDDPFAPDGPSCDIAVTLKAAMTMDHPKHGRIGTVPFGRVAEHSERGWLLVASEEVASTGDANIRTIDLGPTLIELLGLKPTEQCSGSTAFERVSTGAEA